MSLSWYKANLWRDQRHCSYCGDKLKYRDATVDHIVPRIHGGRTNYENLTIACLRCNGLKANMTMDQFERLLVSLGIVSP